MPADPPGPLRRLTRPLRRLRPPAGLHGLGGATLGRFAGFCTRHRRSVLAGWVLAAGVLTVAVPPLERVVGKDATPFIPASAPSVRGFAQMDHAFGSGAGRAIAFVVLTAPGFAHDPADQAYYRALAHRLHGDHTHIADLQDYATHPQLRAALTSEDGDATYLPIAIRDPVGSPRANEDVAWLNDAVSHGKPGDVRGYVTGDAASVANMNDRVEHSIARVTIVSVVIIIAILLLLYRSLIVPLVPLATIGVALLVARGLVSLLGQSFMPVSTYTGTFLTALVLGAGTDYTVFLISRFHEAMRAGTEPAGSVVESVRRIGPVVVASGLTVIIGSACMVMAQLALFRTTGPAIAVAILVTLAVGLTFTPALLAVVGRRAAPPARSRRRRTPLSWAGVGALVARRPAGIALASIALLAALAAFWSTLTPTYDTQALVPADAPSSQGYAALDRHFPGRELHPDYVLVGSDHDLRDSRDLAVLDQVAASLQKVPGVTSVRAVSRPQGRPIPQAQLSDQLAHVGSRLDAAGDRIGSGSGVDRLAGGADRLSSGALQLSGGASRATDAIDLFLAGLAREHSGLGDAVTGTGDARAGALQLRDGAYALSGALRQAHDETQRAVVGLGAIYAALAADTVCTADPICHASRVGLHRIYVGERDRLLTGLAQAADAAHRIGAGDGRLGDGLAALRVGLRRAAAGIARLEAGEREFRQRLATLAGGAAALAHGAAQIPPGVDELKQASVKLARGLSHASAYLTGTAHAARAAGISTFYLPASALDDPRLAEARDYYLSRDGRTARFMVFTADSTSRTAQERSTAAAALRQTPLSGSTVTVTGPTAVADDLHRLSDADLMLVALVTLGAVFAILVLLLRALVAPVYLLASVVLSYGASMGITSLVFQHGLGEPIDFTMPLLAFVILVAVGADYNILLMSRVREESRRATRRGVARAVGATGGVITSAGLIFAGTFVAMTTSPLIALAETGFAVATGLLLDTFVVRSLLVPSLAAVLGRWNWWPGERRHRGLPPALRGMGSVTEARARELAS